MGFMKKTSGYMMLASFILYGGCDHALDKYLKEQYSERAIRVRKAALGVIEDKISGAIASMEEKMSELEKETVEDGKNDRIRE
jgi:hypothetical protein